MEQMDHMVEEALRLNVKWSLQDLSRAINGDGKTMPNPLFKVQVVLTDKVLKGGGLRAMWAVTSFPCQSCVGSNLIPSNLIPMSELRGQ